MLWCCDSASSHAAEVQFDQPLRAKKQQPVQSLPKRKPALQLSKVLADYTLMHTNTQSSNVITSGSISDSKNTRGLPVNYSTPVKNIPKIKLRVIDECESELKASTSYGGSTIANTERDNYLKGMPLRPQQLRKSIEQRCMSSRVNRRLKGTRNQEQIIINPKDIRRVLEERYKQMAAGTSRGVTER